MSYSFTRRILGVILFTLILSVLLFSMSWSVVSQTQPHVPRPYLVADINPGPDSSYPVYLTAGTETLYTFASDGYQRGMWATNGSEENTRFLAETYPDHPSPYAPYYATPVAELGGPATVGDKLFYVNDDGVSGEELWISDGSPTGTMLVKDIRSGALSAFPGSLTSLNSNELIFRARSEASDAELWVSDGTLTQTHILTDIVPGLTGSWPYSLIRVDELIYFRADDATLGDALWRTDGTAAGTELLVDIPGVGLPFLDKLTYVDGLFFFAVYHPDYGREYWRSDGTQTGTWLLKDIAPGTGSSLWYDESNYITFGASS